MASFSSAGATASSDILPTDLWVESGIRDRPRPTEHLERMRLVSAVLVVTLDRFDMLSESLSEWNQDQDISLYLQRVLNFNNNVSLVFS